MNTHTQSGQHPRTGGADHADYFVRLLQAISLVVALAVAAGCALPWLNQPAARPTRTVTPESPLASASIYWNDDLSLLALRASDGQVRWKANGGSVTLRDGVEVGWGPSQPAIANDTVYISSRADKTAVPTVFALNAADGSVRWQTRIAGCPGAAPLAADGVIYVATTGHRDGNLTCGGSGWVYALRAGDGVVLWHVPFARAVSGTLALTNGVLLTENSTYPAVPEVITLTGLRARDGAVLWRISRADSLGFGDFAASDGIVAVTTQTFAPRSAGGANFHFGVEAYRATDGKRLWSVEKRNALCMCPPVIANGLIYVHGDAVDLYALHVADGSAAWRYHTGAPSAGRIALMANRLYFGAGSQVYVLDASSGLTIRAYSVLPQPSQTDHDVVYLWSQPFLLPGAIAVVVAAHIPNCGSLCPELHETLYVLDAATGAVLWRRGQ